VFAAWIKAFFLFSAPLSDFPKNIPHDNPDSHNFSAHAAWVQRTLAWRASDEKMWPLVEKFSDMGSAIALIGPREPSPVKVCLENGQYEFMQKFIDAGAPMNYVDEKDEGALHFLAAMQPRPGWRSWMHF